jgi:hypothetical protein
MEVIRSYCIRPNLEEYYHLFFIFIWFNLKCTLVTCSPPHVCVYNLILWCQAQWWQSYCDVRHNDDSHTVMSGTMMTVILWCQAQWLVILWCQAQWWVILWCQAQWWQSYCDVRHNDESYCDVRHNDDSHTVMSGTMMSVFVRLYFAFLLITPSLGKNYRHQITSKRKRCPDVVFFSRNKDYRWTAG